MVEGQVFVTDDECTHGKASLSDNGVLDGFVIECSLHLGSFDVRTGEVVAPPCALPLKVYQVTLKDGGVWVDVPMEG